MRALNPATGTALEEHRDHSAEETRQLLERALDALRAWREVPLQSRSRLRETFGPVAAVIEARGEEDAVRLADASPFGLGASLWTRDVSRAESFAARIEAGGDFIDGQVKSTRASPSAASNKAATAENWRRKEYGSLQM